MNGGTSKQVGGSSLLRGYKKMLLNETSLCLDALAYGDVASIIIHILKMVHIQQLHLFENKATIFFFFGKSRPAMASQNLLPPLLVMPIGVAECDASPFYIE